MKNNKYKLNLTYNDYKNDEINRHREYKQLCQYVYHNGTKLPDGYEVLYVDNNKASGLYAEVLCKGNNIVIVGRGTDKLYTYAGVKDLKNDIVMARGKIPVQFYSMLKLYDNVAKIKKDNPNIHITLTGHSLSGSLMQMVGALKGVETVTFSAFGTAEFMPKDWIRHTSNIINYGNRFDPVFMKELKDQIGEVREIEINGNGNPHFLESWDDVANYTPLNPKNYSPYLQKDLNNFNDRNKYFKILKNLDKSSSTGYASNIEEYSSGKYVPANSQCAGTYKVSGYTREDGTKVGSYWRTCGAKHKSDKKIPPMHNLSDEEIDKIMRDYI